MVGGQFLEPGRETQSLPVVCRRFLECVETPHLWRLLWLRWIASDAGLLEQAKREAIEKEKAKQRKGAAAAEGDPMDQETDGAAAAEAEATTGDDAASDYAPAAEGAITRKPVQRLICADAAAYKSDWWQLYAKAEAKFNAKALSSEAEVREKAAKKFKIVKYVLHRALET